MSIQDAVTELGMNASANVLRPEKGDLIVLKIDTRLNDVQREKARATFEPMANELGCRFVALEGGFDLMLVSQAKPEGN